MKHFLNVYKVLLHLNFAALVAYRSNFINSAISSIGWGILSIVSIILVTSYTTSVFGWRREELLILTGAYGITIGVFHLIFSRNFEQLAHTIHKGELDVILVKPIDSQFYVSVWRVSYTSLFRILIGIVFTLHMINQIHAELKLINVLGFFVLLVIGILLLYSLWFIVTTFTLWFTRLSNLVDFMFNVANIARFPQEMYHQLVWYVFLFLLPITLIVSTPTKVLLEKALAGDVVLVVLFSFSLFLISRKFWKFALRYYTSASS